MICSRVLVITAATAGFIFWKAHNHRSNNSSFQFLNSIRATRFHNNVCTQIIEKLSSFSGHTACKILHKINTRHMSNNTEQDFDPIKFYCGQGNPAWHGKIDYATILSHSWLRQKLRLACKRFLVCCFGTLLKVSWWQVLSKICN